ncbi:hypothetical protein CYMTET_56971 [Cymbomonas tetramitiformis]|uniref:Uncharacterized protein n=1 Tax=Cymbomonas tetramitiformis TaxID=36881 RepID=A0AAE0BB88_9CHLO|nr:hypothetical protein CYMTET_56971 [Cymbomonas tetramitiformis]
MEIWKCLALGMLSHCIWSVTLAACDPAAPGKFIVKAPPAKATTVSEDGELSCVCKSKTVPETVTKAVASTAPFNLSLIYSSDIRSNLLPVNMYGSMCSVEQLREEPSSASLDFNVDLEPPGAVTYGDVTSVVPFSDTSTIFTLQGKYLQQLLNEMVLKHVEHIQRESGKYAGSFLQTGALRYAFNLKGSLEEGSENAAFAEVYNKQSEQYEPLDPGRQYKVITNSYTYSGGDGYTVLFDFGEDVFKTGQLIEDTIVTFLNNMSPYSGRSNEMLLPCAEGTFVITKTRRWPLNAEGCMSISQTSFLTDSEIWIGLALPLFLKNGNASHSGSAYLAGSLMAIKEIRHNRELLSNHELRFAFVDSKCDGEHLEKLIWGLMDDGLNFIDVVVGAACSSASIAAQHLLRSIAVPQISVYVAAHALHHLLYVEKKMHWSGADLKDAILQVSFTGASGLIGFDSKGDRTANVIYTVLNHAGDSRLNPVGYWSESEKYQQELCISNYSTVASCNHVIWSTGEGQPPSNAICANGTTLQSMEARGLHATTSLLMEMVASMVSTSQVLNCFATYKVDWPDGLMYIFNFVDINAFFSMKLLSISFCNLLIQNNSMHAWYIINMVHALGIPIIFIALYSVGHHAIKHPQECKMFKMASIKSLMFTLFAMYPFCSANFLTVFSCRNIYGTYYMIYHPEETCFNTKHVHFMVLINSTFGLLLFIIGVPTFFMYCLSHFQLPHIAKEKEQNALLLSLAVQFSSQRSLSLDCRKSDSELDEKTLNDMYSALIPTHAKLRDYFPPEQTYKNASSNNINGDGNDGDGDELMVTKMGDAQQGCVPQCTHPADSHMGAHVDPLNTVLRTTSAENSEQNANSIDAPIIPPSAIISDADIQGYSKADHVILITEALVAYAKSIRLQIHVPIQWQMYPDVGKDNLSQLQQLERDAITHSSFLFAAYHPRYWYFEVIDTFRKLILIAVPVLKWSIQDASL